MPMIAPLADFLLTLHDEELSLLDEEQAILLARLSFLKQQLNSEAITKSAYLDGILGVDMFPLDILGHPLQKVPSLYANYLLLALSRGDIGQQEIDQLFLTFESILKAPVNCPTEWFLANLHATCLLITFHEKSLVSSPVYTRSILSIAPKLFSSAACAAVKTQDDWLPFLMGFFEWIVSDLNSGIESAVYIEMFSKQGELPDNQTIVSSMLNATTAAQALKFAMWFFDSNPFELVAEEQYKLLFLASENGAAELISRSKTLEGHDAVNDKIQEIKEALESKIRVEPPKIVGASEMGLFKRQRLSAAAASMPRDALDKEFFGNSGDSYNSLV